MDDIKAENEHTWREFRESSHFRESFEGQCLELHKELQVLKQSMKQTLPRPVWKVAHWLGLL